MDVLIVGFGNALRGDDGAGLDVARQAALRLQGVADVRVHPGEPVDLIEGWGAYGLVVLVDAAAAPGSPGGIRRYELGYDPLPAGGLGSSTHAFDLLVAIELARAIGRLPRRLVLYAVEGERFSLGDAPSDAVMRAVAEAADRICAEVLAWTEGRAAPMGVASDGPKAGGSHA